MPHTTKQKIHLLVDEINDEEVLNMVMEDVVFYTGKKDIMDELSPEQLNELEAAIKEVDENETISLEGFKKQMHEWKEKL